jgi:large subunit ribosomal protein L4
MEINIFDLEGKKVSTQDSFTAWDSKTVSPILLHQVAVNFDNNKRIGRAHTKDRSERRGGGIKPWKQKGTGRARSGSSRSPIWRKGGVAFGPRSERNYVTHTPKGMNRTALAGVLVGKIKDEEMVVLSDLPKITGKTKELVEAFGKLPVKGVVLFLVSGDKVTRAPFLRTSRNLQNVIVKNPEVITANDLLRTTSIVTDKAGIVVLENRISNKE